MKHVKIGKHSETNKPDQSTMLSSRNENKTEKLNGLQYYRLDIASFSKQLTEPQVYLPIRLKYLTVKFKRTEKIHI